MRPRFGWASLLVFDLLMSSTCATARAEAPTSRSLARPGPIITLEGSDTRARFERAGLSLREPYARGKVPVVLIHGLWSAPRSWSRMIEAFRADPSLRDRCQFWTFGYATTDPIPYSAFRLRQGLREARRAVDPGKTDPAFDRMVLIGHSMGGLLAKMMVQESRSSLWELIGTRPFDELGGPPDALELLRQSFFFEPLPEVRRVIFIATPHRGSPCDRGPIGRLGAWKGRPSAPLQEAHAAILARNDPELFSPSFRHGPSTSVDQLTWENPLLMTLCRLKVVSPVEFHSIIADLRDPPREGGTDGVVPYRSAHLDGAASELLVPASHLCQDHPLTIREARRILLEHLGEEDAPAIGPSQPVIEEVEIGKPLRVS